MNTTEWKVARQEALKTQVCLDYIVRATAKIEVQGVINKYAIGFTASEYQEAFKKTFTRDKLNVLGLTRLASLELAVAAALKEADPEGQPFKKETIRIAYAAAWDWSLKHGKPEPLKMLK